jgi:thiol-disulfide isomerase/thioredoxin
VTDVSGKPKSLKELKGDKGAVLMFVSSQCPVVRAYNDRMNAIAADYAAKGITFIGINSNATEMEAGAAAPQAWVKEHIAATYKFPVYFDKGNVLADKLGATVTPEAYFLDPNGKLLYHGAIDNSRDAGNVTEPTLKIAFDSALAGKPIAKTSRTAFGCSIKRAGGGQ